ncbi:MAG: MBL fold metallo-hydrolase [Anaerolineales bacterium]
MKQLVGFIYLRDPVPQKEANFSFFMILCLFLTASCASLPRQNKGYGKIEPTTGVTPIPTETVQPPKNSSLTPTEGETTSETPVDQNTYEPPGFTIKILCDNYPYRKDLKTDWGFAALVEYKEETVLFDTGASGSLLLTNMKEMGIDPQDIDKVVLSHAHGDHIGGLQAILDGGGRPVVYLLPSFSASYKEGLRKTVKVVEVKPEQKLFERIYTTGEIHGPPPEQSLILDTTHGLVVITGCAHPGVVTVVSWAKNHFREIPTLVMGGFHLFNRSEAHVQWVLDEFQRLGVERVAPCHCSGVRTREMFAREYSGRYLEVGAGRVIEIER